MPQKRSNDLFAEYLVEHHAEREGVPLPLVKSIAKQETGYLGHRSDARSPAGARGTMQVMPNTGTRHVSPAEFETAEGQILAGVREVKRLNDKYKDPRKVATGYHGGEGAIKNPKASYDRYANITSDSYANEVTRHMREFEQADSSPDLFAEFMAEQGGQPKQVVNPSGNRQLVRQNPAFGQGVANRIRFDDGEPISQTTQPVSGRSDSLVRTNQGFGQGAMNRTRLDADSQPQVTPPPSRKSSSAYRRELLGEKPPPSAPRTARDYTTELLGKRPTRQQVQQRTSPSLPTTRQGLSLEQQDALRAQHPTTQPVINTPFVSTDITAEETQKYHAGLRPTPFAPADVEALEKRNERERYLARLQAMDQKALRRYLSEEAKTRRIEDDELAAAGLSRDWLKTLSLDAAVPLFGQIGSVATGIANLTHDKDVIDTVGGWARNLDTKLRQQQNLYGEESLPHKVLQGGFSSLPYFVGSGAGAAGKGIVGILGALQNSGSVYNEAIQKGATEDEARKASVPALGVGAMEMYGIGGTLGRVGRKTLINRFVQDVLREAGEEATQEMTSQALNNLIAKGYYDPSRDILQGVPEAGLIAAITGGAFGAAGNVGARVIGGNTSLQTSQQNEQKQQQRQQQKQRIADLREERFLERTGQPLRPSSEVASPTAPAVLESQQDETRRLPQTETDIAGINRAASPVTEMVEDSRQRDKATGENLPARRPIEDEESLRQADRELLRGVRTSQPLPPQAESPVVEPQLVAVSPYQHQQLRALGYTDAEIANLPPEQVTLLTTSDDATVESIDEPSAGLTPAGSGTSVISNEELARGEVFLRVDRGGNVTYLGKQPDVSTRQPEGRGGGAVVAVSPDGSTRLQSGDARLAKQYGERIRQAVIPPSAPSAQTATATRRTLEESNLAEAEAEVVKAAQQSGDPHQISLIQDWMKENRQNLKGADRRIYESFVVGGTYQPTTPSVRAERTPIADYYMAMLEEFHQAKGKESETSDSGKDAPPLSAEVSSKASPQIAEKAPSPSGLSTLSLEDKKEYARKHGQQLNEFWMPDAVQVVEEYRKTHKRDPETPDLLMNRLGVSYGQGNRLLMDVKRGYPFSSIPSQTARASENSSESPPHHSATQPRRARNTATGKAGQFKKGKPTTPSADNSPVTRKRSLPKTLEEAGLPTGDDLIYSVIPNEETVTKAKTNLADKGVDGAAEFVRATEEPSAELVATGLAAIAEYQKQGDIEKAGNLAADLSAKLTAYGQAVQAVQTVSQFSPEIALMTAEKIAAKSGKKPSNRDRQVVTDAATKLQAAQAKIAELENVIKDFESRKASQRQSRQAKLVEQFATAATEARQRLAAMVKGSASRSSERGAVSFGNRADDATIADLATVMAAEVAQKDVRLKDVRDAMASEFGQLFADNQRRVEREADRLLREANPRVDREKRPPTARQELRRDVAKWDYGIRQDAANNPTDPVAVGAEKLARGMSLGQWRKEMTAEFGLKSRKLDKVFQSAQAKKQQARTAHRELGEIRRAQAQGAVTDEQIEEVRRLLKEAQKQAIADRLEIARTYDRLAGGRLWHIASAMRKSVGLLSSPVTHAKNIGGNMLYAAFDEASRVPGVIADYALMAASGQRSLQGFSPTSVLDGVAQAMTTGLREAKDIILHGQTAEQAAKLQLPAEVNSGSKVIDVATQIAFRLMGAEDRVFYNGHLRRNLRDRATIQAKNEVKAGTLKPSERGKRIEELVKNPPEQLKTDSEHDALVATFNNSNRLSDAIRRGRSNLTPAQNFAIDMVVPFDRTPTNILIRLLEATPIGVLAAAGNTAVAVGRHVRNRAELRRDAQATVDKALTVEQQRTIARSFGRGVTGSALLGIGYALASAGLATGLYDDDDDKEAIARKRADKLAGRQPLSIRIGNQWVQVGALSPVGMMISIGAALRLKDIDSVPSTMLDVVTEQPLLDTAKEVTKAAKGYDEFGNFAGRLLGSFVPSPLKDVATLTDDKARKTFGFKGQIYQRVPGLRQTLPEDVGVEHRRSWVIDPLKMRTAKTDVQPPPPQRLRDEPSSSGSSRRREGRGRER